VLKKYTGIFIFFISFSFVAYSQDLSKDFLPLGASFFSDSLFRPLQKEYLSYLSKEKNQSAKIKDYFKETTNEMFADYCFLKNKGHIMYNDTLTRYVQRVFNEIVFKNNIDFKKPGKVFILRSDVPNAANSGSEIFFFNLGLIACLNSESELAAIICHEISHEVKQHVFTNMLHVGTIRSSRSYKKEVRISGNQKYNSYSLSKDLYYKIKAKELAHSKNYELQADSLGFFLLKNSGYNTSAFASALAILDSVDTKCVAQTLAYESIFNSKEVAFDKNWLKDTESFDLSSNLNFTIVDSLKTHPDCEYRISQLPLEQASNKDFLISPNYSFYRSLAKFEEIEILRKTKNIDKALYQTVQLLAQYKNNLYLNATFYYCLYEILEAKKEHRLSEIVSSPARYYPRTYNEFLIFLNQVPSSALKIYAKAFLSEVDLNTYSDYSTFVSCLIKSIDLSAKDKVTLSDDFAKLKISPIFKNEIQERFNPKIKK